jgi:outer membrane protein OmpA-like peptidoglycan-associated protein
LSTTFVAKPGSSVDTTPTAFFRDTPTTTRDRIVDGYIVTAETPAGKAADATYVGHISTLSLVNEALTAYNGDRIEDAHALYQTAAARPDGEQLRVLNGLYLTSDKLGLATEAEGAFGRIVALGLAANNLGIRILFRPNTTDYVADARLARPYPMWLRRIAQEAVKADICLRVVGHTSHTGTEPYNDRLSLQRALYIKRRMETDSPELANRIDATGAGWRENIVGTGTDDMTDALDRRVEFRRRPC